MKVGRNPLLSYQSELSLLSDACNFMTAKLLPFTSPIDYIRIKVVNSLHELITASFQDRINAFCSPRTLPGDFHEVVAALPVGEGIVLVDEGQLASLALSDAGKVACDILLADLENLRAYDL